MFIIQKGIASDGSGSNFPGHERVRVVVFVKFSGTKRVRVSNFLTSGFGYLFSTHKRISGIIYEAFWQYRSICRFSNHKDDHNSATQSVKLSF